ncbi:hypothetical protein COY13_00720 [Candidatus Roizmanbacteria bacterium CG_4_10_14_0_2_um_filter_36_35]|uniref:O-antigen ligase-related domain-containing protein n=4 Tax=Candidatus Roizmaniibacteriota TaxID=1752723 RepID=A0A2M7BWH9_9BACT|nr:MAG: hypothetical protein COV86_03830 [Candidatus Roizmanbacteria bacterium CG11_big_fil_rev_8_21_14_0_20_35_14]PIV10934.1 MAG: hypothetical protein COS50_02840 [Candidatus Roizmanbacteria bacterium CG03_land_8_20_14_0_80_35_26]PIZ68637.1 MAG: hypothetical protein COY13_00720 [Candidatus Roizmanbacteria bacterium CG_4_10_14_0_2_um_filter_36_35]PJC30812.1 MAG: hypothetical protein CO049_04795 [Candidatus Roizmanbacteria bacterium CG_4_9_14_0_2_um_filter_36_12]PJC80902.1 MAG: hypothetical prot
MDKLLRFVKWIDNNLVKILLSGFIFLVPLWPKLPIRMINYTYIAIRFEDIYLTFMILIFIIQLIRKKIRLTTTFLWLFILFWISVFASTVWGIYFGKTIDFYHLGYLHALRRVEYMSVFFIAASVIKNRVDFFHLIKFFFFSVFLVSLYGLGQKFLGFPAVQTMNPEYAKGYILSLTPEARISSTFAGHYDLASYLAFVIPLIISFSFFLKKRFYLIFYILALFVLTYTSSRISFVAYAITVFLLLIFIRKYFFLIFAIILTALVMFSSGDLINRFLKTVQFKRILVNEKTGSVYINQNVTTKELPAGSFYVKVEKPPEQILPTEAVATEVAKINTFKEMIVEQKVIEVKKNKYLSPKETNKLIASLSAELTAINTFVSDISFATRLQIEWPRAINAFNRNKLLGSGPSSITEATDNDYLRWLGETGLLGTTLFLMILFFINRYVWLGVKKFSKENKLIAYGFTFALIALLINATYIDVFEASKMAYTFWTVAGLFTGYSSLLSSRTK